MTHRPCFGLGAALSLFPHLPHFTQLLLTAQNQHWEPFHTPPCLAAAPISDGTFLLGRSPGATSLPTVRTPMSFSLESYKTFMELCKGKRVAVTHTFQATEHTENLLKKPNCNIKKHWLQQSFKVINSWTDKTWNPQSFCSCGNYDTQTYIKRWFLLLQFQVFKCKGF